MVTHSDKKTSDMPGRASPDRAPHLLSLSGHRGHREAGCRADFLAACRDRVGQDVFTADLLSRTHRMKVSAGA